MQGLGQSLAMLTQPKRVDSDIFTYTGRVFATKLSRWVAIGNEMTHGGNVKLEVDYEGVYAILP